MNRIDFTVTGGFPFDQGTLEFLQDETGLLQNIASLFGPLVIVSGCVVGGGSASDGFVIINGEVLPFIGGVLAAKVIVVETPTTLTYEDASTPEVVFTRIATFGDDGIQNNPWADFVRPADAGMVAQLNTVWLPKDVKEIDCDEAYIAANFDGTGLGTNERLGWAICNGNNGTKNRLGKIAVQRDPAQTEFADMTITGGEKKHLLAANEGPTPPGIPPGLDGPHNKPADGGGAAEYYVTGPLGTGAAAAVAHNNLQPYLVTLFIQKL